MKDITKEWLHNVYPPNKQDQSLPILDAWGGQKEEGSLPKGKN